MGGFISSRHKADFATDKNQSRLALLFFTIISFRCSDTEALANGRRIARFVNVESVARRKLYRSRKNLKIYASHRAIALKNSKAIEPDNIAFA